MDEEFKLCWKNFQDNIASGFQNLYDRGDLVDVTLACDGKLLHAHKIVLAICSPYFKDIFASNPCKHPIIILKDVSYNIMCELLDFMYQGVVNVKQAELQSFMKIGQLLQIKGLATNSSPPSSSSGNTKTEKPAANQQTNESELNQNDDENRLRTSLDDVKNDSHNADNPTDIVQTVKAKSQTASRSRSPSTPTPQSYVSGLIQQQQLKSENNSPLHQATYHAANAALKRQADYATSVDSTPLFSVKKQLRRSLTSSISAAANDQNSDLSDVNESGHGMDSMSTDDFILPSISMVESRYDLNNPKGSTNSERDYRENAAAAAAAAAAVSLRNPFGPPFGFDYNLYKNSSNASSAGGSSSSAGGAGGGGGVGPQTEYPNDLHMPNDYSKSFNNHMEIPSIAPGEHWFQGNLEFMLSQRGKPLLVHDGHTFGIQYVRKDKKYWQCNLSRKYNCKARVTTTETGDIIVTNNEHCHTEIRQHLRKDYQRQKVMMNALINLSTNHLALRRQQQQQQQQNSHHQHHVQQQQHSHQSQAHQQHHFNLNSICSQLQQTLTAPQPLAAHSAAISSTSSNALSMQRLIDLGKLTPNDHATLTAVLQKQQSDDDETHDMPLDCGLRSAVLTEDAQPDAQKVISLTKNDETVECKSELKNTESNDETSESKHD